MISIKRDNVVELGLKIRAKQREAEEVEDKTRAEKQVYSQKVKHLMHAQRNNVQSTKDSASQVMSQQKSDHQDTIKRLESEAGRSYDDIQNQQAQHSRTVEQANEDAKASFQRYLAELQKRTEKINQEHQANLEKLYEDYNLQRINEVHEIQERKDHHIMKLIKQHQRGFEDLRNFYNKLTKDHLETIFALEAEVADREQRIKNYEQKKRDLEKQIVLIDIQFQEKSEENRKLKKILSTYDSDKMALANSRARLVNLGQELEAIRVAIENKQVQYKKVEAEKESLIEKFEASVHDVKQKTEFRASLLEKKVESLDELLRTKAGQLEELTDSSEIDPAIIQDLTNQVAQLLTSKNVVIANLEYEVAKETKMHNDLIRIYQAKLIAAGVPAEEIAFEIRPSETTLAPAPSLFH